MVPASQRKGGGIGRRSYRRCAGQQARVVTLGEPVKTATWTVIPLDWRATFPQQLFPKMTGRVELAPVDKAVTRLTVSGMYEPPLGKVGKELNATLMQGVADNTVKELAEAIAKRLEAAVFAQAKKGKET